MTPKQLERLQTKIKSIRATLAAEKRKYGAYDDSRGLRYQPPKAKTASSSLLPPKCSARLIHNARCMTEK